MKKIINTLLLGLFVFTAFGQQANLTVFNENPEPFFLIVDGLLINNEKQTNVLAGELSVGKHQVKVVFQDSVNPDIIKTVDLKHYQDLSFILTKTVSVAVVPTNAAVNKWDTDQDIGATYKLKEFSNVIREHKEILEEAEIEVQRIDVGNTQTSFVNYSGTQVLNSPPQQVVVTAPPVVPTPSFGLHLNYNQQPTTTNVVVISDQNQVVRQQVVTTNVVVENPINVLVPQPLPIYTPPALIENVGCSPMTEVTFSSAQTTLKGKSFDDTRLEVAKQIAQSNCLTSNQIKRLAQLFTYENSRLDFAKYAYTFCYDPQNYFIVNDAFTFDSSVSELTEFITR